MLASSRFPHNGVEWVRPAWLGRFRFGFDDMVALSVGECNTHPFIHEL